MSFLGITSWTSDWTPVLTDDVASQICSQTACSDITNLRMCKVSFVSCEPPLHMHCSLLHRHPNGGGCGGAVHAGFDHFLMSPIDAH